MKTLTKLVPFTLGFVLASLTLTAAPQSSREHKISDYNLPEYKVEDISVPVAAKVVRPRVTRNQIGHEVTMFFNIEADGSTSHIYSPGYANEETRNLATTMRAVLRHWQFEPARDKNGNPVAVKVALPVRVQKNKGNARHYAGISLDQARLVGITRY